jgi:hypothetical protein
LKLLNHLARQLEIESIICWQGDNILIPLDLAARLTRMGKVMGYLFALLSAERPSTIWAPQASLTPRHLADVNQLTIPINTVLDKHAFALAYPFVDTPNRY